MKVIGRASEAAGRAFEAAWIASKGVGRATEAIGMASEIAGRVSNSRGSFRGGEEMGRKCQTSKKKNNRVNPHTSEGTIGYRSF